MIKTNYKLYSDCVNFPLDRPCIYQKEKGAVCSSCKKYVSVNAKSKHEASQKTLLEYANRNVIGEFHKPWKAFSSVCGGLDGKEKRWIVDVDDTTIDSNLVKEVMRLINICDSGFDNNIVCQIPTKSGVHIITHPFNMKQFNDLCEYNNIEAPGIKKNHITLLYENL